MSAITMPDEEELYLIALLDGADGLDLAEMVWHDPESPDGCYRAWDFQWNWYTCTDQYQADQGGRATGKALDLETLVPTPTGMTTMGALTAGDEVFDEAGQVCQVLQAHEVRYGRPCYEVEFSDGTVVVADAEHLWLTSDKAVRRAEGRGSVDRFSALQERRSDAVRLRGKGATYWEIAELLGYADATGAAQAVRQGTQGGRRAVAQPAVRSTEELASSLHTITGEANHSVAVAAPLFGPVRDLPVDPYLLGYWLGDGTSRTSEITVGDEDQEWVLREVVRLGYRAIPRKRQANRASCFRLEYGDDRPRKTQGLQAQLRQLGVLGNKHLPMSYLRASERQRRDLLAGLVDSDGTVDHRNGRCEISLCAEVLARGVYQLVASLGEKPTWSKAPAMLRGVDVGVKYRVGWQPQANSARMPRKAARYVHLGPVSRGRASRRHVVDVRPVMTRPVRCITVDSPSALYLVTEAMIPTHNTVSITMRAFAFPFNFEGQSMLITAPELNHLRPLTDAIEKRLLGTRLMDEMLPRGKGRGMARQPHWQCTFKNKTQLISRLPSKDGKGVKSQHVINIELDEAQDYPLAGWIEVVETLNAALPGSMWRVHGVPKGVRDSFFDKTQPGSGWRVHRPMAQHRPTWGAEERDKRINEYRSRQNIDYKRNIYGEHGDASNSVFVLARLIDRVDIDSGSEYNTEVYQKIVLEFERQPTDANSPERQAALVMQLEFSGTHRTGYSQMVEGRQVGSPKGYSAYWAGMDVGVTTHPSEILVFGQRQGEDFLELLTRINMQRINTDDQMAVVDQVFAFYGDKLKSFALDKTGVGFPVWDILSRRPYGKRVHGYGFSEKVVVAFEDRPLEHGETQADLAIWRNVVEASTDWLRNDYVDGKRFRLPNDSEVLQEFQGQVYSVIRDNGSPYGTRKLYSGGSFHSLDAAKVAIAGKHLPPLAAMLDRETQVPVLDLFVGNDIAFDGGLPMIF